MHGIENLSFIVRAEANRMTSWKARMPPLGTTIFNIYDEDVQFFVRLTEGQRKKKNNTSEIVILILVFVKTEKSQQTNKQTAEDTSFIRTRRRVPHLVPILLANKVLRDDWKS